MRFKYLFTFALMLMIIFSLGTVVASENIDDELIDNACLSVGDDTNQDLMSTKDREIEDAQEQIFSPDIVKKNYETISTPDNNNNEVKCSESNLDIESDYIQLSTSTLDIESDDDQLSASALDIECNDVQSNENLDNMLKNQNTLNSDKNIKNSADYLSRDETDLSVYIDIGKCKKIIHDSKVILKVPFIITAVVSDGVAENVIVHHSIPSEFKYVSHYASIGTYYPNTGIWKIGTLDNTTNAILKIYTNISQKGRYGISVNATTNSNDRNLSNNEMKCVVTVKIQNTTTTTVDPDPNEKDNDTSTTKKRNEAQHNPHPLSDPHDGVRNHEYGNQENYQSNEKQTTQSQKNNFLKSTQPNIITKASQSLNNTKKVFDLDSSSKNNSSVTVLPIEAYDYTQIPILIFILFLLALAGIYGYDKIKS